jgi:hypothetical protein
VTIRNGISSGTVGGGGILILNSSPTIEDCVIENCYTPLDGGAILIVGVAFTNSATTIRRCTLFGNRADRHGGGLAAMGTSVQLGLSVVEVNSAGDDGGGVYGWNAEFQITWLIHTAVQNNIAKRGGGIYAAGNGSNNISSCLVSGNVAAESGGGISLGSGLGLARIYQCTIVENQAGSDGSGVKRVWGSPVLENSIVWANWPGDSQYSIGISYAYCCLPGGSGTNISSDPLFTAGFRLGPGSPCIDAGDDKKVPPDSLDLNGNGNTSESDPFDFDLLPRFVDDPATPNTGKGVVDIGCYERQLQ